MLLKLLYADSKDLAKTTSPDTILKKRAYEIASNRKCDGYQRRLASMVCKLFDKKTGLRVGLSVNEELAQGMQKPVNKNFKRRSLCKI